MVSAVLALCLLMYFSDEQDAMRILVIAAGSTAATVLVSGSPGRNRCPFSASFIARSVPPASGVRLPVSWEKPEARVERGSCKDWRSRWWLLSRSSAC